MLRRLARLFIALDFVTLVDESIVDGNDSRCLLPLLELRLLANGMVHAIELLYYFFFLLSSSLSIFVACFFSSRYPFGFEYNGYFYGHFCHSIKSHFDIFRLRGAAKCQMIMYHWIPYDRWRASVIALFSLHTKTYLESLCEDRRVITCQQLHPPPRAAEKYASKI